jgi:ribulose-5-phosphate 4-epimerase/fuculose-1-phosphate aldolase
VTEGDSNVAIGTSHTRMVDDPVDVSEQEWELRVRLAACYRIVEQIGWSEVIYNHISARLPGDEGHLLINPFGLTYREVTASNLVKVDLEGNVVGHSRWPVNAAGIVIHTAIHAARPDVGAVMHTHSIAGSAVACLEAGLDPDNFYAAELDAKVAYHEFEGITVDPGERQRIVESLGARPLLVLRNHGLLSCGQTIAAAFGWMYAIERACRIQLAASSAGPLHHVSDEARRRSSTVWGTAMSGAGGGAVLFDALWREVDAIAAWSCPAFVDTVKLSG